MKNVRRLVGCVLAGWLGFAGGVDGKTIRLRTRDLEPGGGVQVRADVRGTVTDGRQMAISPIAETDGRGAYLVQFSGRVTEADRRRLARMGAVEGGYVPEDTLMVLIRPEQLAALSALDGVSWVGGYEPVDRMEPGLAAGSAAKKAVAGIEVVISVLRPGYVAAVAEAVERLGGTVTEQGKGARWGTVRAVVPAQALPGLAGMGEVEWIERYVPPVWMNDVAVDGERMNVRNVWTNHGLRGTGQIIAVGDSGLDTGNEETIHPDFSNRIEAAFGLVTEGNWSDPMGHGTHVAGSVLGSGAAYGDGQYAGVAPEARLVMQAIGGPGTSVIPPSPLNLMFEQAWSNRARIHTDSWGSSVDGAYTANARSLDEFMWDFDDMLVLFSAGNSGRDTSPTNGVIDGGSIGSPRTAKNCLTVGAAESARPSGSGGYSALPWGIGSWLPKYSADPIRGDLISTAWDGIHPGMAAFTSRGPCDDGRTKPDIVAPGTDIISCRSRVAGASTLWGTGSGVLGNAASNWYTFSGGTSMSTPLTAGAAGLARQYLCERAGITNPSAAMLKALLVNGARSLSPGQYGDGAFREIPAGPRPNNVEGWGQVNLDHTLYPGGGKTNLLWDRQALTSGQTNRYPVQVTAGSELNITLAWSDYPATLSAGQQLVNDLDLRLVAPSGTNYYPSGGTGPDRTNNLEGIDVAAAEEGTHWIEVSGYNVPEGPQRYALMAKCAGEAVPVLEVYGAWHAPMRVCNGELVRVQAAVAPGPVGLATVVAAYRVNGQEWSYVPLEAEGSGGQSQMYGGVLPSFQAGDQVDYAVNAVALDLSLACSETNTFFVDSTVLHVSEEGTSQWPYDDWSRAFTNLQEALDIARDGQTVLVTNGVYSGTEFQVAANIALQSVNGPEVTILDGNDTRRCATVTADARISGFAFHGGYTLESGGGVSMSAGTLSNCIIRFSSADQYGGGVFMSGGNMVQTRIYGNEARYGGGVFLMGGSVSQMSASNNSALYGGGAYQSGGILLRSGLHDNYAEVYGGGLMIQAGTIAQSAVTYNLTRSDGGGIELFGGTVVNCTLAKNHASGYGGGIDISVTNGVLLNNIIYQNTAQAGGPNWYKWRNSGLYYCCTSPDPEDEGSFDADPLLADSAARDCHLKSTAGRWAAPGIWVADAASSPCLDAGYPGSDYSLEPEPNGGRINLGAYGGTEEASKTPGIAMNPVVTQVVAEAAGGLEIVVEANVSWAAESGVSWLAITGGTPGSGAGTVIYRTEENPLAMARTGTVTVSGGGVSATCTVVQAGAVPALAIAPATTNVPGEASGGHGIAVTANLSWAASANPAWLTLTGGATGTGSGTVVFAAGKNPSTVARTGTVVVAGGGLAVTCAVVQAGSPALAVTPASRSVDSASGTVTFAVSNRGEDRMVYAATEAESWLAIVSGAVGTNSGILTVSVEANTGPAARTGTVTVTAAGAGDSPASVTVIQSAGDAYEADNTRSTAKAIGKGQTQRRTIHVAGDEDGATFTVGGTGARNVQVETGGPSGDTQVWLIDAGGAEVAYDDNSGDGAFSRITVGMLVPGTYFIRVREYGNDGTIPAYTLKVDWSVAPLAADAYEADDRRVAARSIGNGQTQNRTIHAAGNEDWVQFRVGAAGGRDVELETAGETGDTQMWLFREDGELVAYNDNGGAGAFSRMAVERLSPGTYFLRIREHGNNGTIPFYTLRAEWRSVPVAADAFEADNQSGAAKAIGRGEVQRRTIHVPGDWDWARFTVGRAGATGVRVETSGATGDTQMWLYRQARNGAGAGRRLAYDDDGGVGDFSRIAIATLPAGTYYIKVQEHGNNGRMAEYRLQVRWSEP